jgi:nitroimidazol reductase NimA-like FMN-containing flavoprotein (pyridoxamine 5'-phosphate oxidase superfamily)
MTDPTLEALSVDECWSLASSAAVGRVAVALADGQPPLVVPVNYLVHGERILFRTSAGQKLHHVVRRSTGFSFQVDQIDPFRHTGWSVLIQGTAEVVDVDERPDVTLEPWVPEREHWIRLLPTAVTGRRIELHQPDLDPRGYR